MLSYTDLDPLKIEEIPDPLHLTFYHNDTHGFGGFSYDQNE
jgi:hypothetical protein